MQFMCVFYLEYPEAAVIHLLEKRRNNYLSELKLYNLNMAPFLNHYVGNRTILRMFHNIFDRPRIMWHFANLIAKINRLN